MNYLWQILLYLLTAFLLHHGGVSIIIWSYGKEDLISLVIITLHRKLFECYQSKPTRTQLPIRKKARYPKDLTKIQEKSNHLVVVGITVVAWLRMIKNLIGCQGGWTFLDPSQSVVKRKHDWCTLWCWCQLLVSSVERFIRPTSDLESYIVCNSELGCFRWFWWEIIAFSLPFYHKWI